MTTIFCDNFTDGQPLRAHIFPGGAWTRQKKMSFNNPYILVAVCAFLIGLILIRQSRKP